MSATREDIYRAIRAADSAGNAEDVKRLASFLQSAPAKKKPSFGLKDVLPSIGRGVTSTLGMAGDIGDLAESLPFANAGLLNLLPNTGEVRAGADKAIDAAASVRGAAPNPESSFSGGEDTLPGRALEFAGGTVAFGAPSLIKSAAREGAKMFSKTATRQFAGGAAAGAGSFVGEEVAGTKGAVVGSFVPAAIGATAKGVIKTTLRGAGASRQMEMRRALAEARRQGAQPTVGSVSSVPRAATIERSFESIPGSHGPFLRAAKSNQEGLQRKIEFLLKDKGYREETAGGFISSSLKKTLDNFRRTSSKLYDDADRAITNQNAFVSVKGFRERVKDLAIEETGSGFDDLINSVKQQDDIASRLLANMVGDGVQISKIPFHEANRLRKVIGQQISLSRSVGDPSQGVLKQLYRAISKDVQAGAEAAGGAGARKAFNTANAYWRRNRKIVDRLVDPLLKKGLEPEALFRNVVGTALNKPTKLSIVMRGMSGPQRDYLARTFVARLGNIDDTTGRVVDTLWSPGRFLRNWEKIPTSRKNELFKGGSLPELRRSLDRYFSVLERQKNAAGMLANPSGTAGTGLAAATLQSALANTGKIVTLGLGGAVALGGPIGALASIGMAMGGANVGARLMTSPKFLNWLATASASPVKELPKHLVRLNSLANDDPEFVEALDAFNSALLIEMSPNEENQ